MGLAAEGGILYQPGGQEGGGKEVRKRDEKEECNGVYLSFSLL